jgi:hypothetical protein
MRVKLTALVGDNATSGLLLDGNYQVHRGPDNHGRVLVFDFVTDSFRTVGRAEYRQVPDPLEAHELVRIRQDDDGYRASCSCRLWEQHDAQGDPDGATQRFKRVHLQQMERGRYHLTAGTNPGFIAAIDAWHKQQWRRRQGEEPER